MKGQLIHFREKKIKEEFFYLKRSLFGKNRKKNRIFSNSEKGDVVNFHGDCFKNKRENKIKRLSAVKNC